MRSGSNPGSITTASSRSSRASSQQFVPNGLSENAWRYIDGNANSGPVAAGRGALSAVVAALLQQHGLSRRAEPSKPAGGHVRLRQRHAGPHPPFDPLGEQGVSLLDRILAAEIAVVDHREPLGLERQQRCPL